MTRLLVNWLLGVLITIPVTFFLIGVSSVFGQLEGSPIDQFCHSWLTIVIVYSVLTLFDVLRDFKGTVDRIQDDLRK